MRSRHALAVLVALALTWPVLAMNEQSPTNAPAAGTRAFEMRTYYAHPGRLEALHKRFREHTSRLFRKHGMDIVGYWVPTDKPDVLVYVLAYPSRAAGEASWKAFQADPEWQKAKAESEKDGPIVAKVESVWMSPTDYSPIK